MSLQKYTISSTNLRTRLFEDLQEKGIFQSRADFNRAYRGYQAHHIIPIQIARILQKELDIPEANMAMFDEPWNCAMLKVSEDFVTHLGSHDGYTNMIWQNILTNPQGGMEAVQQVAAVVRDQINDYMATATQSVTVNELDQMLIAIENSMKEK